MTRPPITPGPWLGQQTSRGFYTVTAEIRGCRTRTTVCAETGGESMVEEQANARAIAALPDLLAALETALSVIEDLPYPANHPADNLRAALTKAGYTF